MLINILIAASMIFVTSGIHASGMELSIRRLGKQGGHLRQKLRKTNIYWVGGIILLMFCVLLVEVLFWAIVYLGLNAIEGFEDAFYFSMVTFTTLGYGDIVLDEKWRLLASFEAANGIIMFGWTTAIVITTVQRIYFPKGLDK